VERGRAEPSGAEQNGAERGGAGRVVLQAELQTEVRTKVWSTGADQVAEWIKLEAKQKEIVAL